VTWLRRLFGAMSREEMAGISLTDPRWVLTGQIDDPSRFLSSLHMLVPQGAMLFVEGGSHPAKVQAFLEAHQVDVSPRPALGTLWPRHRYCSLPATREILAEMASLTAALAEPEICDHLHVFSGENVLLQGHDAFGYNFYVSSLVAEQALKDFCSVTGCGYQTVTEKDGSSDGAKGQANNQMQQARPG
jgi:hypothetical protein